MISKSCFSLSNSSRASVSDSKNDTFRGSCHCVASLVSRLISSGDSITIDTWQGLLAGALAFIPFFGPIASGVLAVLLAFMQGPELALYVAILCVVIQQIEGNLLMPLVQRWAVELPPVLGITAAVIFGLLFGLPGVILASPLMVVAMVLVRMLYVEGVLEA